MKILAITQARYGSTRLPAKILKEVNGQTLLEIHLRRILQSKTVSKLKIATTDEEGSKYIVEIADKVGVEYFKGSVEDVLSRFYGTAETEKPDYVIRLTSDCPLIDPNVIDTVVTFALEHPEYDYVHTDAKSFPDGIDTEVVKFSAIEKAYKEADLKSEYAVKGAYGIAFSSRFIQDPFDQIHLPSHKRLFCGNPLEFRIIL